MDVVVYNGRLYAAPVLVVVVGGEGLYVQRRWWGMVWIVGFYHWLFIMVNYVGVLGVARLGCINTRLGVQTSVL
jgi:hypothetical protein